MIDFHTHLIYQRELKKDWLEVQRVFSTEEQVFSLGTRPLEEIINRLDVANVQSAVVLPINCKRAHGIDILSNHDVKQLCTLSDRFIGFASVDPLCDTTMDRLDEAKSYGLCGLKLDPGMQQFKIQEVLGHSMWKKVAEWNWPVVIHVGYSFAPRVGMFDTTVKDVEMLAHTYPKINFVVAHWGFPWVLETCLVAMKYPNVYLDTSATYFDNPKKFTEFIVHQQISVSLIEKGLFNKVIFGSNYPRNRTESMKRAIEELSLSTKCKEAILRDNASRLINSALGG